MKIAVLDDYQGAALGMSDWSIVKARASITIFRDHVFDEDSLVRRLLPFDAICIMRERTPLSRSIIERLPALKFIASSGPRNASIDLTAASERGVLVSGTASAGHGAMELTWALIHAASRHLPSEIASLRAGGWQIGIGGDLKGSTLGIMGLGRIGRAVARVAHAFEMNVIAWSQNLTHEAAAALGVLRVDKDILLSESDYVTLHMVLSERSRNIVGANDIALMKSTGWLVNTSRGPLVNETALIDALHSKRIAGAALDVFDIEPLPADHILRRLPNVIASPHIGFVTRQSYEIFFKETVENLIAWMDGSPVRLM